MVCYLGGYAVFFSFANPQLLVIPHILLEKYATDLLSPLVEKIENISKDVYAGEVGIHFVSSLTGEGMNEMSDIILNAYYNHHHKEN